MKNVIVTGGSKGIGASIVKKFANNGYNVVLNYNKSESQAIEIRNELKKENINIEIFKADISKREEVKELIKYTVNKFGGIDVLINNAGIDFIKPFNYITDEEWNKIISVNLNSVFYCVQEALPIMLRKKDGCIINITSIWGITGASCEVAYSMTKAAVDGITKSLAKELGPSNIRVNSIAPGIIDTEMNKELNEQEKKEICKEIPLGRIGNPEEIADGVFGVVANKYITGQIIEINGGWN